MKALIVAQQLRRRVPGGIGTYVEGLVQGLVRIRRTGIDVSVSALVSRPPRSAIDPVSSLESEVIASRWPSPLLTRLWDRDFGTAPLGFDVVQATSLAFPPAVVPIVVAVHDVAWRHFPEAYTRRGVRWHDKALQRALRLAARFIVPARWVADDLIGMGVSHQSIAVVPYGCDHLPASEFERAEELLRVHGVGEDFVLSVGTLEPRKNLPRVIEAFASARPSLPGAWPMVVVGPEGWGEHRSTFDQPGVIPVGKVEPGVLAALYERARLLIYVPLMEGFGLPPLEAMLRGTPVVSSALPSTAGASLEVDPNDSAQIAAAINEVFTDDSLRKRLIDEGRRHAAGLTWQATARKHLDVYEDLCGV